jgi:hypothetical protein
VTFVTVLTSGKEVCFNVYDILWHRKLELLTEYIPINLKIALTYSKSWKPSQIYRFFMLQHSFHNISLSLFSIRHTALLELVLHTSTTPVEGPPMAGLTGLERLSIVWNANDNPNELESSLAHLYELIRPTLTTLVELRLDTDIPS